MPSEPSHRSSIILKPPRVQLNSSELKWLKEFYLEIY